MKRAFEFIDEKSHKFWWIETSENKFVVNYGKIDSIGKYEIKEWDSVEECEKQATKLINSKIRKGYKEVNFDYNNHYYFDDMEYDIVHTLTLENILLMNNFIVIVEMRKHLLEVIQGMMYFI